MAEQQSGKQSVRRKRIVPNIAGPRKDLNVHQIKPKNSPISSQSDSLKDKDSPEQNSKQMFVIPTKFLEKYGINPASLLSMSKNSQNNNGNLIDKAQETPKKSRPTKLIKQTEFTNRTKRSQSSQNEDEKLKCNKLNSPSDNLKEKENEELSSLHISESIEMNASILENNISNSMLKDLDNSLEAMNDMLNISIDDPSLDIEFPENIPLSSDNIESESDFTSENITTELSHTSEQLHLLESEVLSTLADDIDKTDHSKNQIAITRSIDVSNQVTQQTEILSTLIEDRNLVICENFENDTVKPETIEMSNELPVQTETEILSTLVENSFQPNYDDLKSIDVITGSLEISNELTYPIETEISPSVIEDNNEINYNPNNQINLTESEEISKESKHLSQTEILSTSTEDNYEISCKNIESQSVNTECMKISEDSEIILNPVQDKTSFTLTNIQADKSINEDTTLENDKKVDPKLQKIIELLNQIHKKTTIVQEPETIAVEDNSVHDKVSDVVNRKTEIIEKYSHTRIRKKVQPTIIVEKAIESNPKRKLVNNVFNTSTNTYPNDSDYVPNSNVKDSEFINTNNVIISPKCPNSNDITTASNVTETNLNPSIRRSGRPRKTKVSDNYVYPTGEIESTGSDKYVYENIVNDFKREVIVIENTSTPLKKRGRPRKIRPETETQVPNEEAVTRDSNESPVVSKKYVKKKVIKELPNVLSVDEEFDPSISNVERMDDTEQNKEGESVVNDTTVSEENISFFNLSSFVRKGRGRPTGAENQKLAALKRKRIELQKTNKRCKCAICAEEMFLREWDVHNMKNHNLLAWIEGEPPVDLKDEKLVFKLLQLKIRAGKSLVCEKCSTVRSSSHGFIAHMKICQKTEEEIESLKVTCSICQNTMLPQSMTTHMKEHNNLAKEQLEFPIIDRRTKRKAAIDATNSFKKLKLEFNESDKIIIKKFYKKLWHDKILPSDIELWDKEVVSENPIHCIKSNCGHSEMTKDALIEHIAKCSKSSSLVFQCRECKYISNTKDNIIEHIRTDHNNELSKEIKRKSDKDDDVGFEIGSDTSGTDAELSDGPECESSKSRRNVSGGLNRIKYRFEEIVNQNSRSFHRNTGQTFANDNFSSEMLFTDFLCNDYKPLSIEAAEAYFPVLRRSCNMAHTVYKKTIDITSDDIEWKRMNLFESTLFNGSVTFWCGGPVWSLGWIPGERESRFLSVAADRDINSEYFERKQYSHKSIIQIWNVGDLSNLQGICKDSATMAYGIAHEYGVVWDMDWCPSGCDEDCKIVFEKFDMKEGCNFKNKTRHLRMGLLAIACSNGKCYIYSVCHPSSLPQSGAQIYQTEPSVELNLNNIKEDCSIQATKICWSSMKGHNTIAAGYSDGTVALFDISTKSPLLKSKVSDTVILYPYHSFKPSISRINGLVILPKIGPQIDNDEPPVLGITSVTSSGIWSGNTPVIQKLGRFMGSSLSFPWPQILTVGEELQLTKSNYSYNGLNTTSFPKIDNEVKLTDCGLMFGGGVCDTSIWNNSVICANLSGDVFVQPVLTPMVTSHKHIKVKKRATLSLIEEINLCGTPIRSDDKIGIPYRNIQTTDHPVDNFVSDTITYDEAQFKYGLLFQDIPYNILKPPQMNKHITNMSPIDRWPLRSLLSLKYHPSPHAHWFHACGGRAGHVRIMCVSHLANANSYKNRSTNKEAYF